MHGHTAKMADDQNHELINHLYQHNIHRIWLHSDFILILRNGQQTIIYVKQICYYGRDCFGDLLKIYSWMA